MQKDMDFERRKQKVEVSRENLRKSVKMREAMFKSLKDEREARRLENVQIASDHER